MELPVTYEKKMCLDVALCLVHKKFKNIKSLITAHFFYSYHTLKG